MRGATLSALSCIHLALISIHAPTRGATCAGSYHVPLPIYFNPHSHEGSDNHTIQIKYKIVNFNPRSHEGSDWAGAFHLWACVYFNPRSHEGSDADGNDCTFYDRDFNPRSHEGSDFEGVKNILHL